jgi:hypothetical protein
MQQFQDGQTVDIPADQIDADFNYRRRYKPADMADQRSTDSSRDPSPP